MIGLFYEKGFAGTDYMIRVGEVSDIVNQLAYVNDWMCLVHSGNSMGPKSDQPKLKKLRLFLENCEDRNELEGFNIKISTGELGCVKCAETAEELKAIKHYFFSSSAYRPEYHDKINGFFERLSLFLAAGEIDLDFFRKLSSRQYITSGIARDDYLD